jgi:tetratricopeptide (TPR) repeat protein
MPELTPTRWKVVEALIQACRKEGAFTIEGKGADAVVRLDEKKIRAVVAARRKDISPELIDALLAVWVRTHNRSKPLVQSLVRACGEETKDARTLGTAAFMAAHADQGTQRLTAAAAGFRHAARKFAAANETRWQAASLEHAGRALASQGEHGKALECHRQAMRLRQALYPKTKYSKGHTDLATSLFCVGQVLHYQGQNGQALEHYLQALPMFQDQDLYPKDKFPDGHTNLAACLNNVGLLLQAQGNYSKAHDVLTAALQMNRRLYPKEKFPDGHLALAMSLHNVGLVLSALGDKTKALDYLTQALRMREVLYPRPIYPNGHPHLAACLNSVGSVLQEQGEHAKALQYFTQALRMNQALYPAGRVWHHPEVARSFNNMGSVLQEQGEHAKALDYLRKAFQMWMVLYPKAKNPSGHPELARTLTIMGRVRQAEGEHAKALTHFRQALEMRQRLYPEKEFPRGHPDLAASLTDVGLALHGLGEYRHARELLTQALVIQRALHPKDAFPHGHPALAGACSNVAMVLADQREDAKALEYYLQAIQMYPKDKFPRGHPHLARHLNNVGYVLVRQGEGDKAFDYFAQALRMRQEFLYPKDKFPHGHPELAGSLNNVGVALYVRGEYGKALDSCAQAVRMFRALYPDDKYPYGHLKIATALNQVGIILHSQGKYQKAHENYSEALRIQNHAVDQLASSAPEDRALNFAATRPIVRDFFLSTTIHMKGSASSTYAAVWPTRSAVARVYERRHLSLLAENASPQVRQLYSRLLELRQQRTRLLLAPLPRDTRARDHKLEQLVQDIEKTEEQLLPLLPAEERSQRLARSTPVQLQKALPAKTAFVDILHYLQMDQDPLVRGRKGARFTTCYVAFVLSGERLARVDLGAAKPIDEALDLWRRALVEGGEAAARHGQRVRQLVWVHLARELKGIDTVYLAPDAGLTRLPWAALPGDKPGTVLLEQMSLAVVPHGVFLLDRLTAPRERARDKPALLAVGGVRYDDRPTQVALADLGRTPPVGDKKGLKWEYLKGSEKELNRVKGLAGRFDLRTLTGAEASTPGVLRELPRAAVAHLATHGFFADARFRSVLQLDEQLFARQMYLLSGNVRQRIGEGARNPLVLSGLVLAGANRPDTPDRGILTADDVTRLDLRKLDLAVLSACETGLGEVGGGEGVYGLQRAFHIAGCRNVVATLWKVDDEATAAFMELFYRFLWQEKQPPLLALRSAQLALYQNPDKVKDWSAGRGIDPKKTVKGSGAAKPPPAGKRTGKAHAKLWAAFVLSGLGT